MPLLQQDFISQIRLKGTCIYLQENNFIRPFEALHTTVWSTFIHICLHSEISKN